MEIILTHENADFDAVAGLLAASCLFPGAVPALPDHLNQNVAHFLALYQNGLPFIRQTDIQPDSVSSIIVVDAQRISHIKGIRADVPMQIIDHHPLVSVLKEQQSFTGESVGAVTTLLVEQIRQQSIALNSLQATLLALGIYEDTGAMTYGTTTSRDILAAAWLVEQGAVLDTVRRFLAHPLNDEQQALLEKLISSIESRTIEGITVIVASATVDHYVTEVSSVAHRMRDMFDSTALFVLVQMPKSLQMVARSSDDVIDVGKVARVLGGGGHGRASAASIHGRTISECSALIWQALAQHIQPVTLVADLMSYGVHTVDSSEQLDKIVRQLRRIGHEGYPVVEAGRVIGLLMRRDMDRAIEHGLGNLPVRDVMMDGAVTLHPEDSVFTLEQRMVETGWGQIPIIDNTGKLIGIVTRTDLIKHWVRAHPSMDVENKTLSLQQIESVLGKPSARLIESIASRALVKESKLYLVGGVVRDLLLARRNLDIDFVVEGSAVDFVRDVQSQYGGRISTFLPFGTAKWILDESVAEKLKISIDQLPSHIDFATARNEFYEHPTALPTVYNGSIKLDLHRRDFTINTLALQLSPATMSGHILDFYGGLVDLQAGKIRVLHSLSFVDDPTRILRAVRFERRLGFMIEARTSDLITSALPMLGRITGERIRNELNLLLKENEPEQGLMELQNRGVLKAIHAAFVLDETITDRFHAVRAGKFPWSIDLSNPTDLYWHILAAQIPFQSMEAFCERLMFGRTFADSLLQTAHLIEKISLFAQADLRPSEVVLHLDGSTELALLSVWLVNDNRQIRERIQRYWTTWRHIHAVTTGYTLREIGLKPGPCYSLILSRLRDARLDGEVQDEASERVLLDRLITQGICDDSP